MPLREHISPSDAPSAPKPRSSYMLKVPVSDLQPGMYVCEVDRPWLETPFAFQGFPLRTRDDIEAVQKVCEYVMVDVAQSDAHAFRTPLHEDAGAPPLKPNPPSEPPRPAKRAVLFNQLFDKLKPRRPGRRLADAIHSSVENTLHTVDETEKLVVSIMDNVRLGMIIDTPAAKAAISETVDQIIRDQDAMLLLSSIKNKDHYTQEHSLNVAILSIILGRALGMSREALEELGLAGMLHDVGKVLTPDDILKKPGRLTEQEFLIMKMHPTQGRDILLNSGITGMPLEVVHGHHERLDGSGYPRGLLEEDTPFSVKLVAIADTFDAITSDRVYGNGRTNIEAFKILQASGGNHFDNALVSAFIDVIGIYPPGSVVQLDSGEFGLVVHSNSDSKLRPVVLVLKDRQLHPVEPHYVDLSQTRPGDKGALHIAHMLRPKDVGIDTQVFRDQRILSVLGG